jgi:hypothetical protein
MCLSFGFDILSARTFGEIEPPFNVGRDNLGVISIPDILIFDRFGVIFTVPVFDRFVIPIVPSNSLLTVDEFAKLSCIRSYLQFLGILTF